MADRTSEHLIRIVVQGVNRLGDVVQRGTQAVEKHTKAVEKDDAALKQSARTSKDAQRDYEAFVKAVRDGEKDYDSAREGLKRLAAEMDRLSRKEPVGSKQAEGLHAQAQAARALADQLRRDASERDRLAKESVRVEEQAAAARTRARKKEADDFLGDVRRTLAEEERRRSEAAVRLDRLDAAEAEKRSKRRIDDAVREAQAVAEAARSAPDPRIILGRNVPISRQRPPLIQRVRSFFTQQDSNSLGGFEQQVARADRSASRAATNGFSRLEGAFGRVSRGADGAGFSLAKVDNKFRGLIFVSIIALAQQLISAFVGVAGAAVAVAGAAIQAGEALGGVLTAGAAQAIPVLGLVAAAFARIKAVFAAVKLSNLAATKSSYDNATSSDAQAAASDRVASAQEQVVASTQRVKDATVALTDAREQARRKIQDLDQAERDASLQRFDAAQALKRAVATGDVGALEGLRNQRASADTQASRTTADASTARSQGVAGSPDVERAQRELADATTALAKSRRELDAAGRATTKAADFGAAADRNLSDALAQLSPAERALYQAAVRIQARFRTVFRPITDIIVRSFTRGVDGAEKALGDSRVIKTFTRLADVFASSVDRIRKELTSSRSLNFFQVVGAQAAQNIPLLTTLAIRVERILQAFAVAGGPALHRFIEFFVDLAGQGERATNSQSGIARLEHFFLRGEQMTESFLKLGGAIIQLFAALAGSSAETGIGLVEDLTRSIQEATVWVKKHQDQVHAFFDDAAKTTEVVAGAIFQVAKAAVSLFDSDKVKAFADVFEGTLLPALTAALGLLSQFTFLLSKVLSLPVVGDLAKFALSFFLVGKVIRTLAGIVVPVVEALEGFGAGVVLVGGRLAFLAPIILRVAGALRFAVGILLGPWGLAIAAVITGIYLLDKRFHFIAPTIKFLGQVFSDVFKAIKKNVVDDTLVPIAHFLGPILSAAFSFAEKAVVKYIDVWAGFVTQMLGGISTLATVASHLPLIGDGARKMFAGLATFVDGFRDKADKAREALRKLNDENAKGPTRVDRLQVSVQRLERRLSTLKDGTEDYRKTAIQLASKQADLNQAMVDAQDAGKKGARGPRAIGSSATDASKAFDSALASMAKGFNSFAGQLGGVKKLNFSAVGAGAGVSGSVSDASKPGVGFAAGGWIGRRGGPQGPDDRIIRVGQGEAVLAVPHQPLVDRALRLHASLVGGPSGLDEMFGRVKGYVGAFASGGRVGGANFGGHPTNVNPFVRRLIAFMQGRFPLSVSSTTDHSTYTTSGNVSDHVGGNAVDLYNPSTAVLFRASEYIKKSGLYKSLKQGIHNPNLAVNAGVLQKPPGQFAGAVWAQHADHIHLAIVQALGKIAGGVAGSVSGHIKSPKITGPAGRLKDLLNESIKKIATAANKKLDSAQSTTSVGGSGTAGTGISPGGNVVGNILALAKHAAYVNKVPWNESIERVLLQKESGGGKNLPPHDYGGGLDPSGPMQVISCVPFDTEILTKDGWKKHDDVVVGDETIGLNVETGNSEWTTVRNIVRYADAQIIKISHQNFSARVTADHRWRSDRLMIVPVEEMLVCPDCDREFTSTRGTSVHLAKIHDKPRTKTKNTQYVGQFVRTADLVQQDRIVTSALASTGSEALITCDEAELLGWILGDGSIRENTGPPNYNFSVSIYQSKPRHLEVLKDLVSKFPHGESVRKRSDRHLPAHTFRLRNHYSKDLIERSRLLEIGPEAFVLSLSPEQCKRFLDGITWAEGCVYNGYTRITQADGPIQDAIIMAIYLTGSRPIIGNVLNAERPAHWQQIRHIGVSRPFVSGSFLKREEQSPEDVWCVETDLGTWTMRQDRQVLLTGNSTFAAYALPGHKNRANPYDNVLAAFNYIKHRYGTLENLAARTGLLGDGYKGYERGGDVPGVGPKASVLHGGEHVWTASEVMRVGGHKVMYALRSMLGGGTQGGPRAYALGGRTLEIGDSLGVGTQGYLKKLIDGLVVNNRGGRASPEALKVLQGLINKSFGRVVFDIGTNDDPPSIFAASLKRLSKIVGDQRELFLNRLHGPGAAEKNKILDAFASANDNVRVINPGLKGLAGDGIHFEAAGYTERARAIAKALGSGGSSPSTSKSEAGYTTPTVFDTSLDGVARQLAAARKAISSIKTRSTKFSTVFARSMEQISGDGGLLDQGTAALERLATSTAARLKRLTYRVTSSGLVVRRTTDQQDAAAQIKGIDQQLSGSQRLRDSAAGDLTDVDRRLAVLRRGGVTSKERKSYETLVAARRSLVAKIATLDGTIADTIESRFQAQEQVIQTGIDAVNQTAQKGLTRADLSDRVATIAEGFVGGSSTAFSIRGGALDQRARILRSQREGLTPLLAQAQAQGNTKLVDDLVGQIEELNVAIAENTAAVAQNSVAARQSRIDDITSAAARASTAADLADRVASVVEASGNSVGAFSLRGRTLLGRRSSISSQRDALSGELARAQSSFGGTTAEQQQIQDLTDQIADLDVQLQENAQAISDNTVAARQSAIDSITGRGGFLGGVFGGLSGIVKALGALAGSEDTKQIASIAQAAGLVLAQTGAGLRDQLLRGFGVDLRGLDPQALVNALRSLNFDGVEANLSVAQRQQFEALIQAVIDNAGAVVDNTQQLADLNSTTAQSFSTTAWQLFRQAIFNGSGGLLPQYSLPNMSLTSGLTSSTPSVSSGAAGGSTSLSRSGVVGSETIEVHLTNPTETTDPQWIGEVLAVKRPLARAR